MGNYETARDRESKSAIFVYDFPDLATRFVSRRFPGIATPGGWTLFVGAVPEPDSGDQLDIRRARLTVGSAGFSIPDADELVTAWIAAHDATLHNARVSRKEGFADLAEADFHETRWRVSDVAVTGPAGGGWAFELESVLGDMSRGLYDDVDGQSFRLDSVTYPTGLSSAATTITLGESPKGQWREPGYAFLWDSSAKRAELVRYTSIGGTGNKDLQGCTRRQWGGGAVHTFLAGDTQIIQVWAKRGNPIDIALEWLMTTNRGPAAAALYANGDLEAWTAGSPDGWTEAETNATIAEESTRIHGGAKSAKITKTGGFGDCQLSRSLPSLVPGKWYLIHCHGYSPGGNDTGAIDMRVRNTTRGKEWDEQTFLTPGSGSWVNTGVGSGTLFAQFGVSQLDIFTDATRNFRPLAWGHGLNWFQVDPTFAGGDAYQLVIVLSTAGVFYVDGLDVVGPFDSAPNGPYDVGDGDGLGIRDYFFDLRAIELVRDELWRRPAFSSAGALLGGGTANLIVDKSPIRNLRTWIEEHILQPYALLPRVLADERLAIETYFRVPVTPKPIGKEWRVDEWRASEWKRGFRGRVNNLRWSSDWNPSEGESDYSFSQTQTASITRYGEAQPEQIDARGARTGRLGFPDYGSKAHLLFAGQKILFELANPPTPIRVKAFYKHKDLAIADVVSIDIPTCPNLKTASRGVGELDAFLVTRRRIQVEAGERELAMVELELHLRRPISRPCIVAANTVAATYGAATLADKQQGYIGPNTEFFPDGEAAYTVVQA